MEILKAFQTGLDERFEDLQESYDMYQAAGLSYRDVDSLMGETRVPEIYRALEKVVKIMHEEKAEFPFIGKAKQNAELLKELESHLAGNPLKDIDYDLLDIGKKMDLFLDTYGAVQQLKECVDQALESKNE